MSAKHTNASHFPSLTIIYSSSQHFNRNSVAPADRWDRFNYYRVLIRDLGGIGSVLGFDMSETDMEAFIECYRERAGAVQSLLPRLRTLPLTFQEHAGRTQMSVPSLRLLVDILDLQILNSLHLCIVKPTSDDHSPSGWLSLRLLIEQTLECLFRLNKVTNFEAFIMDEDIPATLVNHLPNTKLQNVKIHMYYPAPQGRPNLMALSSHLASLPALWLLDIYEPLVQLSPSVPSNPLTNSPITGHFPIMRGFTSISDIRLSSTFFLHYIPVQARASLTNVDLRVTPGLMGGTSSVVECLRGCTNVKTLAMEVVNDTAPQERRPTRFPWISLQQIHHLTSLSVRDVRATFDLPSDNDIEVLSDACPELTVLTWQGGAASAYKEGRATLLSIAKLARCPLRKLDLPIFVGSGGTAMQIATSPTQRYQPHRLHLRYYQWIYENPETAAEYISSILAQTCPHGLRISTWLELDRMPSFSLESPSSETQRIWASFY